MVHSFMRNIKHDLPASIVVFFVAVPLCLGIALASGVPVLSGLVAGIVGGIVVGSLSGSALGVSGPAAGLVVIVFAAIEQLGSFQAFLLAVVLAGLIQVILAVLKAGVIAYYFPSSVIKGMLSGIGIVIILKQLPHALGYDRDYEGDLSYTEPSGETTLSELSRMIDFIDPGAVVVSLISLAILLTWEFILAKKHHYFQLIPGPLVAVVVGALLQTYAAARMPELAAGPQHLVNIPVSESLTEFVAELTHPDFAQIFDPLIWQVAIVIAVVASLETLLCVEATDKLDPLKRTTPTNRELAAQGAGNMICGLIGGLPITQVIVRSSANIQSGGRTRLSAILHGVFLLLCLLLVPDLLNKVPLAVLACILFIVGYKLARPSLFAEIFRLGWGQFLPFVVTILGVVFIDLLKGITLGLVVAIVVILRDNFRNSHFLHIEEGNGKRKIHMQLSDQVTFLNKGAILNELNKLASGTDLIIDMSDCYSVDYDVIEIIQNFKNHAQERGITVRVISPLALRTADY